MPRRLLVAGSLAVVIVVAVGLLLWSPWSSGSGNSSDTTTPAAVRTPDLTGPAATASGAPNPAGVGDSPDAPTMTEARTSQAVCAVDVAAVRKVAGTDDGQPSRDHLRDAVSLLEDRVAQLQIASEGRPAVVPLVTQAEELTRIWRSALAYYDAGKDADAQAALAGTTTQLSRLEQTVAAVPAELRAC